MIRYYSIMLGSISYIWFWSYQNLILSCKDLNVLSKLLGLGKLFFVFRFSENQISFDGLQSAKLKMIEFHFLFQKIKNVFVCLVCICFCFYFLFIVILNNRKFPIIWTSIHHPHATLPTYTNSILLGVGLGMEDQRVWLFI